ncbi:HAD-IA family hydrolase [Aestuariibacter sp. AA17]|uniref:HAD-IA family hydrolase n=1 Tax=Fluctibacter corallii TaxID=2984329 RepID=A0ABT3A6Z9_9ALTE|nr:HAD-IA family hydrolase [Aestuariibacter sp. AA17]MCV2884062.1 HAD-IA family hydrolase [Aestuariibacter sp. AA17]
MNQNPFGVLFDLDGTLLDTAPDLGAALNHVLAIHSLPTLAYEDYRNVASHGAAGLLKLGFKELLDDYDPNTLREQFLTYYNDHLCVDTRMFDGIDRLIRALDERNVPWGIVTNKPGWLTDALLPHFEAFTNCKVVISGDTLDERKPHPLPLIHAGETIRLPADKIYYVGDAERDIQAANAAGMISVLAQYGYIRDEDNINDWEANHIVPTVASLIELLIIR